VRYHFRTMVDSRILLAACLLLITISSNLYAHGGGLDDYGCHRNSSEGNYHCHEGEYYGLDFNSQQDMLRQRERDRLQAIDDELRELKQLHEEELLTDDEYRNKWTKVLTEFASMPGKPKDLMRQLKRLYDKGLIREQDYNKGREALVERL